jgi:hypothetical protein
MKGFQITFRGKIYQIAPKHGESVFMYHRNGYFHVSVGGLDIKSEVNMIANMWIDSKMQLGESIEIEIKDIHKSSEPSEKKAAFIDSPPLTDSEIKDMFIEKLNNFYILEKLLKDEGLI